MSKPIDHMSEHWLTNNTMFPEGCHQRTEKHRLARVKAARLRARRYLIEERAKARKGGR